MIIVFHKAILSSPQNIQISRNDSTSVVDSIINYGKTFLGKPYRYKGESKWPMDCAGYLSHIFSKYNIDIPRSSTGIAKVVKKIELSEVKRGDILVFKGRRIRSSSAGHVTLVIAIEGDTITMMHSCSRGIITEQYPKLDYYKKRFLFAGRVPALKIADKEIIADTVHTPIEIVEKPIIKVAKDTISVIGVGDMMLGSNYPSKSYLPKNDGKEILSAVKYILADADFTFGNMEGTLLSDTGNIKKCKDPSVCYAFKSPDHYVNYFKEAGFDILSLANNHSNDFGKPGKENATKLLKENNIEFAGLIEYPYAIFERDSITYGFCAFAINTGTLNINDKKIACNIVSKLDSLCDVVIVSFHGGAEGSAYSHITKEKEMFLGENRGNPYKFSRDVIDAGADIVFGHGPHVPRAIDLYKGRFIAYSLGNFATYGLFNLSGNMGIAPIVKIKVDKKGEFINGQIFSTKQIGRGIPVLDPENKALKEIIKLTKMDVPQAPISIGNDGFIRKKN